MKKGETICIHGDQIRACPTDPRFRVFITNSTDTEVDNDTCQKIAEHVISAPIYFSDYYWMYDFKVWDFWCESTNIEVDEQVEINIYQAPRY